MAKSQPVMPRKKPGKPAAAGGAARTRPAGSSASGTTPLVRLETAHPERMNNEQVARTTNRAFNQYLKITRRDRNLLRRHEKHLREGAKEPVGVLARHPRRERQTETAEMLPQKCSLGLPRHLQRAVVCRRGSGRDEHGLLPVEKVQELAFAGDVVEADV